MRIALSQINSHLGDFETNSKKILEQIQSAKDRHCDLVVFPECALMGYHPVDLLEQPYVVEAQLKALKKIETSIPDGITALVGIIAINPNKVGKPFLNSAILISKNKPSKLFSKQLLPTYDVFDEGRHIEPGETAKNFFKFKGQNVLVTICEDIWAWPQRGGHRYQTYGKNPLTQIPKSKVDLVLNLSASPYIPKKQKERQLVVKQTATHFNAPMVYVNMVGAQDELIYDGGSFAVDSKGKILAQACHFEEDLAILDLEKNEGSKKPLVTHEMESIRQAAVLGLKDFVSKSGFEKVHLGLSGGIDSALVACLAVDALGPQNVKAFLLPGPYTSPLSNQLAQKLCENLGIESHSLSINTGFEVLAEELNEKLGPLEFGLTHENLQARIRGNFLMAISNLKGSLLLGTSNKSELAVGYSTLYGDLCAGLLPIGDLLKTQVFELAKHYNSEHELIPLEIITRPPTAELRENQKDEDSLPPYDQLDPVVYKIVEKVKTPKSDLEKRIYNMMMKSEFKRWQAAPILKLSSHAFGRGRRLPITGAYIYP
ncbi:MAG: NAD+ synthase [Bdellovibrionaceae bacterium]|nr:NAD+ synthase [Pseudobdellovibrionaceae bacterium]